MSEESLGHVLLPRTGVRPELRALTDQSTAEFIRSLRLQCTVELLKNKAGTVSEIAYETGFNSPSVLFPQMLARTV